MTARVSGSRSATYRRLDWQLMLTIGRPHLRAADPQASSSAVAPPPEVPRDETASHRGEDQARERVTRMLVGYRRPARLLSSLLAPDNRCRMGTAARRVKSAAVRPVPGGCPGPRIAAPGTPAGADVRVSEGLSGSGTPVAGSSGSHERTPAADRYPQAANMQALFASVLSARSEVRTT